ncbi:MAG: hypothetical protein ACP5H8_02000 [Candidatus Micrarchaeia archaeon]
MHGFIPVRGMLFLALLLVGYVQATCDYTPLLSVEREMVTTLYPEAGSENEFWVGVESNELYTGMMEYYLERDGVTYPLGEKEVYIIPGTNDLHATFKISEHIAPGVYVLVIKIDGFEHRIPIEISAKGDGVKVSTYESEGKVYVVVENVDESVNVASEKKLYNGKSDVSYYSVAPVNGTATVSQPLCNDCKVSLEIGYKDLNARVSAASGIYSEPYLRIIKFEKEKIVFESCAINGYEVFVNGKSVGKMEGIGRVEVPLSTGYEELHVLFSSSGRLLERDVKLWNIAGNNVSEDIEVIDESPITIRLRAKDEYGRDAQSSGMVEIRKGGEVLYREIVDFSGEKYITVNLPSGEYKVEYNGNVVSASAKMLEKETPAMPEQVPVPVARDFVPFLIIVLVIALIVMVVVWLRKWRDVK